MNRFGIIVISMCALALSACGAADFGAGGSRIDAGNGKKQLNNPTGKAGLSGKDGLGGSDASDGIGGGGGRDDSEGDGADGIANGSDDGSGGDEGENGGDGPSTDGDEFRKARFTTLSLCSDAGEKAAGSVLRSQGVVVKLVPADGASPLTLAEDADSLRQKILSDETFSTRLPAVSGSFHVLLCDRGNADECRLGMTPASFKKQDIKSFFLKQGRQMKALGVSEHPVELAAGKLLGAAPAIWVVLDGRRDDADAARCDENSSPLMFDFSGYGTQLSQPKIRFDIDADGRKHTLSWMTRKDSMLLVLDRNGNGQIDSGAELFGNHSESTTGATFDNGFAALAQYDANLDGIIDARDPIYSSLRLWSDSNLDAHTDDGELLTLSERRVKSINLTYARQTTRDVFGNIFSERSLAALENGKTVDVIDVWFRKHGAYAGVTP